MRWNSPVNRRIRGHVGHDGLVAVERRATPSDERGGFCCGAAPRCSWDAPAQVTGPPPAVRVPNARSGTSDGRRSCSARDRERPVADDLLHDERRAEAEHTGQCGEGGVVEALEGFAGGDADEVVGIAEEALSVDEQIVAEYRWPDRRKHRRAAPDAGDLDAAHGCRGDLRLGIGAQRT